MKKKKKIVAKKTSSRKYEVTQIAIFIPLLLLVIGGTVIYKGTSKTHVLGATTGPNLLAQGGDDSSSGSSGSGGSGSSVSGSSGSGSTTSGGNSSASQPTSSHDLNGTTNVSGSTIVDCVGPDGKHITISFSDCSNLNNAWHHSTFTFTPLGLVSQSKQEGNEMKSSEQENEVKPSITQQEDAAETHKQKGKLQVKSFDKTHTINLETTGTEVEVEAGESGVMVKAKSDSGTETQLESHDALEALNNLLGDDLKISSTSAHGIALQSGNVQAHTNFPVSIDPTSGELSITTPAGSKSVTILPSKAVEHVLSNHILTDVQSQVASSDASIIQTTNLTMLGTEPVFEVAGVSKKNFLGIFPIGFSKTSFVSAQTGNIIKTDESTVNKLLESLSF